MGITKALLKAMGKTKARHLTGQMLQNIFTTAAAWNPRLADLYVAVRKDRLNSTAIKVYLGDESICEFSIANDAQMIRIVKIIGNSLETYFNDTESADQEEAVLPGMETTAPARSTTFSDIFRRNKASTTGTNARDFTEDNTVKLPSVVFYEKPVRFTPEAWLKYFMIIDHFALYGLEVGFYGHITMTEDELIVDRIEVPKQKVFPASYDIPSGSIFELDNWEEINCMLHSHVNMPVFFSGTDSQDFRESFQSVGPKGFYVSIVGNVRRELYGQIYLGADGKTHQLTFKKTNWSEHPYVTETVGNVVAGGYKYVDTTI